MKGTPSASIGSRQQYRPGAPRPEEEDAARRRVPRDEAAALLREAVGAHHARACRGRAPDAQAGAQAGAARGADRSTEGQETAGTRQPQPVRTAPVLILHWCPDSEVRKHSRLRV